MSFEANVGQFDPEVRFLARTAAGTLFLTPSGGVLAAGDGVLKLELQGSSPEVELEALEPQPGRVNYLDGGDPSRWHVGAATSGQVRYRGVYSGIDMVWHGSRGAPEYDFVVQPGADPAVIGLVAEGATNAWLDPTGDLVMTVGTTEVRQPKPQMYQDFEGRRKVVAGGFTLTDGNRIGFEVGAYDTAAPLVLDPLIYSTFLGGTRGDDAQGVSVDGAGNVYVFGQTRSTDFPTVAGALQPTLTGDFGGFVTKLNPGATALIYSTYINGLHAAALAVDSSGSAYVAGSTDSATLPVTPGAFRATHAGASDGYLAKLNSTGNSLLYASYLGGASGDTVADMVIDAAGNAYLGGSTFSSDFVTTDGAFRRASGGSADGFVVRLATTGTAPNYSTYLGGSGFEELRGIAVDSGGNAYVTGATTSSNFPTTPGAAQTVYPSVTSSNTAILTKLNATGSGLVFSTYLGGSGQTFGAAVSLDGAGSAYVSGSSGSSDFPTTPGAFQTAKPNLQSGNTTTGFVTKFNPAGSAFAYSTWLGGTNGADSPTAIVVDGSGRAHVGVNANSTTYPVVDAIQSAKAGGFYDAAISVLNPAGSALVFSTYIGGSLGDQLLAMTIDSAGAIYVAGTTLSTNFPTTAGVVQPTHTVGDDQNNDAFLAKVSFGTTPPIIAGSTWYSDGSNAKAGGVGTEIRASAVGAFDGVAYQLILASAGCGSTVAVLNPNTRFANASGFLSTTVGTVPAGVQPGSYAVCFKNSAGAQPVATGPVTFTVS